MGRFVKYCATATFALTLCLWQPVTASAATVWLFGTCGASGANGPSQAQCDTAYGSGVVSVSGGIQSWLTPTAGTYTITAIGAEGGEGISPFIGGLGALIQGTFTFGANTLLQLAVGQMGLSNSGSGGGGGGSFVVDAGDNPLVVGGGGGGIRAAAGQNGTDASTTEDGYFGSCGSSTYSPTLDLTRDGNGGGAPCDSWGSGGGGFLSNGANDVDTFSTNPWGFGGSSWANGITGGLGAGNCESPEADGGFGGGGSGQGCSGGGGGGGYSGGDGGFIAGGGGSYNAGTNPFALAGAGVGHGSIRIELVGSEIPEPASLLLLGAGLAGLVIRRRQLRKRSAPLQ